MSRHLFAGCAVACALISGAAAVLTGQERFDTGQNVQPAFDGWVRNTDGTADLYFGYLNRNFVEELNIPVGPDNNIEPGGPDRGQPTFFLPRRQRYVFSVRVPKEWDPKREVIWTLTAYGRTSRIYGALSPEDELVERDVMTNGSFSALPPGHVDENKPPTIAINTTQAVTRPATLALSAVMHDDGLPKPRPPRVIRSTRSSTAQTVQEEAGDMQRTLPRISWIQFRGPGKATFEPNVVYAADGKEAVSKVSFSAPGTYVLRGFVRDAQFRALKPTDVTVTVSPGPSSTANR
jgi:hypothetical protein